MTLQARPRPNQLPAPPVVPWRTWYPRFVRSWKQGDHILDVGPTQSGKSLLARMLVLSRKYVVVFGTKPTDPTLDEYEALGFTRIDHWPPVRRDFKDQQEGCARFILWPKIVEIGDLHKYRPLFSKCLDSIFIDGRWTVVVDETLWFSSREGLDLGPKLGTMAYGSASNKITFLFLMQRPSGVPRILWSSCTTALIFHIGGTNDVRELASLGTEDPKAVMAAIRNLKGHAFLDLPLRGGAQWSISEVNLAG
jgi:hypothetical protein